MSHTVWLILKHNLPVVDQSHDYLYLRNHYIYHYPKNKILKIYFLIKLTFVSGGLISGFRWRRLSGALYESDLLTSVAKIRLVICMTHYQLLPVSGVLSGRVVFVDSGRFGRLAAVECALSTLFEPGDPTVWVVSRRLWSDDDGFELDAGSPLFDWDDSRPSSFNEFQK